jgi:hypothetical protein
MMAGMDIDLTFGDLVLLSTHGKLEKGGVTITLHGGVLSKVNGDFKTEIGTVKFYVEEGDPRLKGSKA